MRRDCAIWALSEEVSNDKSPSQTCPLTEEDYTRGERGDNRRMTRLFHDCIYYRNCETAKNGGECPHADVGYMVVSVAVTDVLE